MIRGGARSSLILLIAIAMLFVALMASAEQRRKTAISRSNDADK